MKRVVAAALLLWLCHGCSGGEPTIPDRPAFDQAVADYLELRGMGLKLVAYKQFTLSADGRTAQAEISLGDAGSVIKATKRFLFEFENVNGLWRATTLKAK